MSGLLHKLFGLPQTEKVDLDGPQAIELHRKIILSKPFLKNLYLDFYRQFQNQSAELAQKQGQLLELGSGGGFLKTMIPEVITSDVCADPHIDRVVLADRLPFQDGQLKAIFCLNVLHHLADPESFFRESTRALSSGGRVVMIEPYNSLWARFFYKNFHYEPFDETVNSWKMPEQGRLSTSNQALAWVIFHRDRSRFEKLFPSLRIRTLKPHTFIRYALSGGVTYRAFVPAFTFSFFSLLDRALSKFPSLFPIFETIILEKQ
jgi:SAM-dependent methyltransferase